MRLLWLTILLLTRWDLSIGHLAQHHELTAHEGDFLRVVRHVFREENRWLYEEDVRNWFLSDEWNFDSLIYTIFGTSPSDKRHLMQFRANRAKNNLTKH